jgi:hypothetical protein
LSSFGSIFTDHASAGTWIVRGLAGLEKEPVWSYHALFGDVTGVPLDDSRKTAHWLSKYYQLKQDVITRSIATLRAYSALVMPSRHLSEDG